MDLQVFPHSSGLTYIHGNTLDLIVTNCSNAIIVHTDHLISDHYLISLIICPSIQSPATELRI